MSSFSRRGLLAALGTSATLAGCSSLPEIGGDREMLDVVLTNSSGAEWAMRVALLKPDTGEYSEAVVHQSSHEIPPDDGENVVELRDVAPVRRYEFRVKLLFGPEQHYHYRPDCGNQSDVRQKMQALIDGDPLGIRFSSPYCS